MLDYIDVLSKVVELPNIPIFLASIIEFYIDIFDVAII